MNTRCTVCNHPQRRDLERAHIAGATVRELAIRFGRNKSTISAHLNKHVPQAAQRARDAAQARAVEAGDSILNELHTLCEEARRLQGKAERKNDVRTAIAAIRELVRMVELKARILGEIRDKEVSITNLQIDLETAARMAEMFLARRRPSIAALSEPTEALGVQPVAASQAAENEGEE